MVLVLSEIYRDCFNGFLTALRGTHGSKVRTPQGRLRRFQSDGCVKGGEEGPTLIQTCWNNSRQVPSPVKSRRRSALTEPTVWFGPRRVATGRAGSYSYCGTGQNHSGGRGGRTCALWWTQSRPRFTEPNSWWKLTRRSGACRPGRTKPPEPSTSRAGDPGTQKQLQVEQNRSD